MSLKSSGSCACSPTSPLLLSVAPASGSVCSPLLPGGHALDEQRSGRDAMHATRTSLPLPFSLFHPPADLSRALSYAGATFELQEVQLSARFRWGPWAGEPRGEGAAEACEQAASHCGATCSRERQTGPAPASAWQVQPPSF